MTAITAPPQPTRSGLPAAYALAAAIALGWVSALFLAPQFGLSAYGAALAIPMMLAAFVVVYQSPSRAVLATGLLLVMVMFVLNLNFRQRELGETGLDWQNGIKFAVWSAIVAIGMVRWRELLGLVRRPLISLSLAYIVIALLSALWSEVPTYTAASAMGLLAYLALAGLVTRDLDETTILRVMVWSLAVYLLLGLMGGFLSLDVAWLEPSDDETLRRLQGFSGHPNTLGQQAAIFVTLTVIAYRLRAIEKAPAAAFLLLGLAVLVASGSRTNLVAALLAWALIMVRDSRWRNLILTGCLTILASFLMIAATGDLGEITSLVRGLSRTGSESEIFTLTGRTELWSTIWILTVEKPLFGWGYNGIEDLLAGSVDAGFTGTAVNAHNMLLQSLASVGFLGTLPAAAAIVVLVWKFFAAPDSARDQVLVLLLIIGIGEVGIAATPILLTAVVFYFFARDGMPSSQSAPRKVSWGLAP